MQNCLCRLKDCDAERLKTEYQKLVQGLRDANIARETDVILANPGIKAVECIWLGRPARVLRLTLTLYLLD